MQLDGRRVVRHHGNHNRKSLLEVFLRQLTSDVAAYPLTPGLRHDVEHPHSAPLVADLIAQVVAGLVQSYDRREVFRQISVEEIKDLCC